MDFTFIVFMIMLIILVVMIFTMIKNIIKAVLYSLGLFILIALLIGSFFYLDYHKFASDRFSQDKLILLEDNNEIIAGLELKGVNETAFDNLIGEDEINDLSSKYKDEDYREMVEGYDIMYVLENEEYNTEDNFAEFLERNLKKAGYLFMLKGVREKNIFVYPEPFLFKIAKVTPSIIFEKIRGTLIDE
jgi:energy-coupling factor transporter transmembrane protein EcfT